MNIDTINVKEMLTAILRDSSMTEVSDKTGISKVTLYNIIKEAFPTTQFEVAKKLAVTFGYSIELITGDEKDGPKYRFVKKLSQGQPIGTEDAILLTGEELQTYRYLKAIGLLDAEKMKLLLEIAKDPSLLEAAETVMRLVKDLKKKE
jgi:predicted DNA-binding transcriptional regulator AlpA